MTLATGAAPCASSLAVARREGGYSPRASAGRYASWRACSSLRGLLSSLLNYSLSFCPLTEVCSEMGSGARERRFGVRHQPLG